MPTYLYRCQGCDEEFEVWQSIRSEPGADHTCGHAAVRIFTAPRISVAATPSKAAVARDAVAREGRWDKDMPAYKRLRDNGLQPKSIDGCAELETRATTKTEVERGRVSTLNRLLDREGMGT